MKRSTVSGNYEKIVDRENILIPDALPASFFESAQGGFLADNRKLSVAILIIQAGKFLDNDMIKYITSGVCEELFQAIAIASDLEAERVNLIWTPYLVVNVHLLHNRRHVLWES